MAKKSFDTPYPPQNSTNGPETLRGLAMWLVFLVLVALVAVGPSVFGSVFAAVAAL